MYQYDHNFGFWYWYGYSQNKNKSFHLEKNSNCWALVNLSSQPPIKIFTPVCRQNHTPEVPLSTTKKGSTADLSSFVVSSIYVCLYNLSKPENKMKQGLRVIWCLKWLWVFRRLIFDIPSLMVTWEKYIWWKVVIFGVITLKVLLFRINNTADLETRQIFVIQELIGSPSYMR